MVTVRGWDLLADHREWDLKLGYHHHLEIVQVDYCSHVKQDNIQQLYVLALRFEPICAETVKDAISNSNASVIEGGVYSII